MIHPKYVESRDDAENICYVKQWFDVIFQMTTVVVRKDEKIVRIMNISEVEV